VAPAGVLPGVLENIAAEQLDDPDDALIAAYSANIASRLPMFYYVVLVNIVMLSFSFRNCAPTYLTTWCPAAFVCAV
jgi:predicted signal transduction protein with EAL and GGDEF domain